MDKRPAPSKSICLRVYFLRLVKYLSAAALVFMLTAVLINSYDAPLDAEVTAAMQDLTAAPPIAENSYFGHFALGIPEGEEVRDFGVQLITAKIAANAHDGDADKRAEYEALESRGLKIEWRGNNPAEWCPVPFADCLVNITRHRAEILKSANRNALRLDRYRSLYRYNHFYEPLHSRTDPDLWFYAADREHSMVLALAALKAVTDGGDEAVRDLAEDAAYWRQVLAGSTLMVSKMAAAKNIQRNILLTAEILRHEPRLAGRLNLFEELIRPFSEEEQSLKNALWGEFQLFNNTIQNDRYWPENYSGERLLQRLFFKRNSTSHLLHRYFVRLVQLAGMPVEGVEAAAESQARDQFESAGITRVGLVHNPLGKLPLLRHAQELPSEIVKYRGRIHNLDGVGRMLAIQLEIYRAHIPDGEIADYLQKSSVELRDPYRNAPFRWDQDTHELWFEGSDPASSYGQINKRRISVRL